MAFPHDVRGRPRHSRLRPSAPHQLSPGISTDQFRCAVAAPELVWSLPRAATELPPPTRRMRASVSWSGRLQPATANHDARHATIRGYTEHVVGEDRSHVSTAGR